VVVVTPGGTCKVVRAQFIKRESGAPIPTTALLYFVERFLDIITVLAVMLSFLVFFPLREGFILLGTIAGIAVLFYVFARNRHVFEAFKSFFGRFELVKKYTSGFGDMRHSFSRFLSFGVAGKGWLMSMRIWLL